MILYFDKGQIVICIPLLARNKQEIFTLLDKAKHEPADIYEIRLDSISEKIDIKKIMAVSDKPLLVTCRSKKEGGYFTGSDDLRLAMLNEAIAAGAAYVDCERDLLHRLEKNGKSVIIASFHDFEKTPADLEDIVARMCDMPCDWVKFAVTANNMLDNITVFDALRKSKKPSVAIAMGEFGEVTRVLGISYGSRLTFASLAHGHESAPGQLTASELINYYRIKKISGNTRIFGLIGNPVRQSLGYIVHNNAYALNAVDAIYLRFKVTDVREFMQTVAPYLGIEGLSVTMPHKEEALELAASASVLAQSIGAANTLIRTPAGWHADNTDAYGAMEAIRLAAERIKLNVHQARALVIGAGGAARAVAFALSENGCRITIVNRTRKKAEEIAIKNNWEIIDFSDLHTGKWDIIVNATAIGMENAINASPFPKELWHKDMLAFDVVYKPRETRFLLDAEAAGATTVSGIEMFFLQAARQFELWLGKKTSDTIMRKAINNLL